MSAVNGYMVCDGCDKELVNGSVMECVVISRLDHETGLVENLHLCETEKRGPGGELEEVTGCAAKTLSAAAFPALNKRRKAAKRGGSGGGGTATATRGKHRGDAAGSDRPAAK